MIIGIVQSQDIKQITYQIQYRIKFPGSSWGPWFYKDVTNDTTGSFSNPTYDLFPNKPGIIITYSYGTLSVAGNAITLFGQQNDPSALNTEVEIIISVPVIKQWGMGSGNTVIYDFKANSERHTQLNFKVVGYYDYNPIFETIWGYALGPTGDFTNIVYEYDNKIEMATDWVFMYEQSSQPYPNEYYLLKNLGMLSDRQEGIYFLTNVHPPQYFGKGTVMCIYDTSGVDNLYYFFEAQ